MTNSTNRKSANFLPNYYRTEKNLKFLSGTLDQLIKVPELTRINGFVGSKLSKNYNPLTDQYLSETLPLREYYQLEPSMIVKDSKNKVKHAFDYSDLINQLSYFDSNTNNLDKLFRPNFYSYDPHIDWDKFINFREYYWLPTGPATVNVSGLSKNTVSTYTVTNKQNEDFFVFTPNGLTPSPLITLYRGMTYVFNVDSSSNFYIKTSNIPGSADLYERGVVNNGISKGQVIFSVDELTPNILYYIGDSISSSGKILIKTIEDDSTLDVEKEIIGKAQYKSGNGVEFTNGLKIRFIGNVIPNQYQNREFLIEGVGTAIKLIDFEQLQTPESIAYFYTDFFDINGFDDYGFDVMNSIPLNPEYITINRSSKDKNSWSRYNRWFHKDVILASQKANELDPVLPSQTLRASRPIIEFNADFQLYNYGSSGYREVDLIDNYTTDVFSAVEKAAGYIVDEVLVEEGFRVIFNADLDSSIRGKIWEVTFVNIDGNSVINLIEVTDSVPQDGAVLAVMKGQENAGKVWWYDGNYWKLGQQRTKLNQAPLFDLFDKDKNSYSDTNFYVSDFQGNKIFSYEIGSGSVDPVLGFPLKYKNIEIEGTYIFKNYFMTEVINVSSQQTVFSIPTSTTFLKFNGESESSYVNVWTAAEEYQIPVIQFQLIDDIIDEIKINSFDNASAIEDLDLAVFINDVKLPKEDPITGEINWSITSDQFDKFVKFSKELDGRVTSLRVLFKIYSSSPPNKNGYYEIPLNLTNNPLNGPITELTLTEITDHVKTMVDRIPPILGTYPGSSNLRDLPDISKYGALLVSNQNPISFSHAFISNIRHNLIDAIKSVGRDYYQFKLNLIKLSTNYVGELNPIVALDEILSQMNFNKGSAFPYAASDMLAYGDDKISRTYTVTDSRNLIYPISEIFDTAALSNRSVLIYKNGHQLLLEKDYYFSEDSPAVVLKIPLVAGDQITINDYSDTVGCYVPPTPTKLGLYPKFEPIKYSDSSFADGPRDVIQCHDGSIILAFDDYRDDIILEFEKRIFNNLKIRYDASILDINSVMPGLFRDTGHEYFEVMDVLQNDFLVWANLYSLDPFVNNTFIVDNHKTYNYRSTEDLLFGKPVPGNWRGIYKYYFDTDRPNTHPWEMLGLTIKPEWWDDEYGPAPYTSGNSNLWKDLEDGRIARGDHAGINPLYRRPNLSQLIPVNDHGELVDLLDWGNISQNNYIPDPFQNWVFGDNGPVENSWRRSSYWPYVIQIAMALFRPASYASLRFDTSRTVKNIADQIVYSDDNLFLNPKKVKLFLDEVDGNIVLSSGYSVMLIEYGRSKNDNYLSQLKEDLTGIDFNLLNKLGGFCSKDKLQVVIDSVQPNSINPGVLLPVEDYSIFFNVSTPVAQVSISGIIVEKLENEFAVRGYDKKHPYFVIYKAENTKFDSSITVGGVVDSYVPWREDTEYQSGTVVFNNGFYYRVLLNHNSRDTFNPIYYSLLKNLPSVGGVTVQVPKKFSSVESLVPYGTKFSSIQDVYNFIQGYGKWLSEQGFIFEEYNKDLEQTINWNYTGKEFLYWTTHNWNANSVISLSPFADTLKYRFSNSVVDNLFNQFYEYSLLTAEGTAFPKDNFSISREESVLTLKTLNTAAGIYFLRINLIQKEHCLILNNFSVFNDLIYDKESGYRQRRVKLIGFKTSAWNGEFTSPGFIYDNADIEDWIPFRDYTYGVVVKYSGNYFSAIANVAPSANFDFNNWIKLDAAPQPSLIPNFEYRINQFEDFYSLDIDNFDIAQQRMAQQLIGYTPRLYLDNIFLDPVSQYKFYQGYIREKGTKNAIDKLSKATFYNLQSRLDFKEEWAFRVGSYGSYSTYSELEFKLPEENFVENSQILQFVESTPSNKNDIISYVTPDLITISSDSYPSVSPFPVKQGTVDDTDFILPTAGYIRVDDVDELIYDINSLITSVDPRKFQEGSKIWIGFLPNEEWGVYRYTRLIPRVIDVSLVETENKIIFSTNIPHDLRIGDLVAVANFFPELDKIYQVIDTPTTTRFIIENSLDELPDDFSIGVLFKFVSLRLSKFDELKDFPLIGDLKDGETVWVDRNEEDKWASYIKVKNYPINYIQTTFDQGFLTLDSTTTGIDKFSSEFIVNGEFNPQQQFGYNIIARDNLVLTSAPEYLLPDIGYGAIFLYDQNKKLLSDRSVINSTAEEFYISSASPKLGWSLALNEFESIYAGGAPLASNIKADLSGDTRFANINNLVTISDEPGLVKIASFNPSNLQPVFQKILVSQEPQAHANFGSSLLMSRNTGTTILLVGAPGQSSNVGKVFSYAISLSTTTVEVTATTQISLPYTGTGENNYFGEVITGTPTLDRIAVSAPGSDNFSGSVSIYSSSNTGVSIEFTLTQTINNISFDKINRGDRFGTSVKMSDDGSYLFVSSDLKLKPLTQSGKVFVFKYSSTSTQYEFLQEIVNPTSDLELLFGNQITCDATASMLLIAARGNNKYEDTVFDSNVTLFDDDATRIVSVIEDSGTIYLYKRYDDTFIFGEELFNSSITDQSQYGRSIDLVGTTIFAGAPGRLAFGNYNGGFYIFNKLADREDNWVKYRSQEPLVDLSQVKRAYIYDSQTQSILNYIDIFDPVKGNIPGLADQEIRYKTPFDPAIYTASSRSLAVNPNSAWFDNHVGELWWDLSTVKYYWYEQGESEYRKNTWGKLFVGSTIDIYEWVESIYDPQTWANLADTAEGLSLGISGQPKYLNEATASVKAVYNPLSGSFNNLYYFWVKNKVLVPNVKNRRISSLDVSQLITDPENLGIAYLSILGSDSVALTNVKNSLISDRMSLNISFDEIDNQVNKHTEWILTEEDSETKMPHPLIERKLIDSLLGRDSLGNPVPDVTLNERVRYGIEIRPRQSMFRDRKSALRELIDFSNSVLKSNLITGFYNFEQLNSKEEIPSSLEGKWDQVVEDLETLETIDTRSLIQAQLTCSVVNGRIFSVTIVNPGYGYKNPPEITVVDDTSGAILQSTIDSNGRITAVDIINSGSRFAEIPQLTVRPYSVIVQVDPTSRNKWSRYLWKDNIWSKIQTQKFNTQVYWKYIDWASPSYDQFKPYSATVSQPHQLTSLRVSINDYVKVQNGGDGRYLILRKTDGTGGLFNDDWDIVYSQNGTIEIDQLIWNTLVSTFGFDQILPFDQTEFDQTPDTELEKIILALRDDIFVGSLKINWNKFFFTAVKYALVEQKFIDWAFKTSFITAKTIAGPLTQRPTYKYQNSDYYESYLREVKPYRTTIRTFETNNTVLDPTNSYFTDFDLSPYYDENLGKITVIENYDQDIDNSSFKTWKENYKFSIGSVDVFDGGIGYTSAPKVEIIPAVGDTGVGATAEAFISMGRVSEVLVTNPGSGYTVTPLVVFSGGGSAELTPARAYARLSNNKVRQNFVKIKFDRISAFPSLSEKEAHDEFIADGNAFEFVLTWDSITDKEFITVIVNSVKLLYSDYEISPYFEIHNGYQKRYSKLVLSKTPLKGQTISIDYIKNIELYTAVDRIRDYYFPESGMPDVQVNQLMKGIDFPGTVLEPLSFNYSADWDVVPLEEFAWDDNLSEKDLDTILDGGNLAYTTALGVNPADIVVDGDQFISPYHQHAPEENLPGQVRESVGINVYTRVNEGSPIIFSSIVDVNLINTSTIVPLTFVPPSTSSVMVNFEKEPLIYGDDYEIDFQNQNLVIYPNAQTGTLHVTVVSVGGIEFLGYNSKTVSRVTTAAILANGYFTKIQSLYVSANGIPVSTSPSDPLYYKFDQNTSVDQRGKVEIYGLTTETTFLQVYSFASPFKGFSEVKEQYFSVSENTTELLLDYPPGVDGPPHGKTIVEYDGSRLIPPNTTFYTANNQYIFDVDLNNNFPPGAIDLSKIEVYVNGVRIRNGIDFVLNQFTNQIEFAVDYLAIDDELAIVTLLNHDYRIIGNKLRFRSGVNLETGKVVKVITYNNHNGSLIRTETFKSRSSRMYPTSRDVINDNYIWVSVGGKVLNRREFYVMPDKRTVRIHDNYPYSQNDIVTIMTFNTSTTEDAIGYRVFKDVLNRNIYKRLSKSNTTHLVSPLFTTSTTIEVENSGVLGYPMPSKRLPGVILIDGERIEYMARNGNILSQLRRGTFGTGAKEFYDIGTAVIDQSKSQSIPYQETVQVMSTSTTNTTTYVLNSFSFDSSIEPENQIEVYYAGRLLQKPTSTNEIRYAHNNSVAYDSNEINSFGTSSNIVLGPDFSVEIINTTTANLILSFNPVENKKLSVVKRFGQIWYDSGFASATNGESLLDSNSPQAVFLKERLALLPVGLPQS
jgi:predicted lipoprotein